MSDIKPWQIILIVVAIGVLAFSGLRMLGGSSIKGASGHMTVDIMTGQLYMVEKGKARGILYPVKNPDTGERTLYPVSQEEGSDEWIISPRMQNGISDKVRKESDILMGSGGKVRVQDADPILIVIKK